MSVLFISAIPNLDMLCHSLIPPQHIVKRTVVDLNHTINHKKTLTQASKPTEQIFQNEKSVVENNFLFYPYATATNPVFSTFDH